MGEVEGSKEVMRKGVFLKSLGNRGNEGWKREKGGFWWITGDSRELGSPWILGAPLA